MLDKPSKSNDSVEDLSLCAADYILCRPPHTPWECAKNRAQLDSGKPRLLRTINKNFPTITNTSCILSTYARFRLCLSVLSVFYLSTASCRPFHATVFDRFVICFHFVKSSSG